MKCYSWLAILIFVSTLILSCSPKSEIKNFRQISREGSGLVAREPIDFAMAAKTECYRVEFDNKGRIVKFDFIKNGKLIENEESGIATVTHKYDDRGNEAEVARYGD